MRTAFVFCTGCDACIDRLAAMLGGEQIMRDRYMTRLPSDHVVSFRVDLDNLGAGPTITRDMSLGDACDMIRNWAGSEDVLRYIIDDRTDLNGMRIDHLTELATYQNEWGNEIPLANEDALTEDQRETIDSYIENRRAVFHDNSADAPGNEYDDEDGDAFDDDDEDRDDEEVATTRDDDDDEGVVYDADDPLE